MTKSEERMLRKIEELRKLEQQVTELQDEISEIKSEIKLKLEKENITEMQMGIFTVRYTPYISQRFDSKTFKKDYSNLYNEYLKETSSKRFSII